MGSSIYVKGLHDLGHEVFLIEKGDYSNACYDPARNLLSDDFSYGLRVARQTLAKLGLENRLCYVSRGQNYHGLSRSALREVLRTADVFLELGDFAEWLDDDQERVVCVFVDGDPGMTQMKFAKYQLKGGSLPLFDHYFTVGRNIGRPGCPIPTVGIEWKPIFHPVCTKMYTHQREVLPILWTGKRQN